MLTEAPLKESIDIRRSRARRAHIAVVIQR